MMIDRRNYYVEYGKDSFLATLEMRFSFVWGCGYYLIKTNLFHLPSFLLAWENVKNNIAYRVQGNRRYFIYYRILI